MQRIIVIGGSMGAFSVLKQVCADLPADLPAAVFIVIHVAKDSRDTFAHALNGVSVLPVTNAGDNERIEGGHIYVAPADSHLLITDDTMRLGNGPRENMFRPAIDALFRSAAISYGPRAIGVVLSGYLNDGASGIAAIKQCGGTTVVQNPADAKADDMPLSAIEATQIDYRGPTDELAAMLSQLAREAPGPAAPVPRELRLEVDIALGRPCDTPIMAQIADVRALSCPACGGVLSEIRNSRPVRYRCQVGHGYTAQVLDAQQEQPADEALRVALRIIEERLTLLHRMAREDRDNHRLKSAAMYEDRVAEYERSTSVIRQALLGRDV